MNRRQIDRQKRRIERLINKYEEIEGNGELISHWSRYLCVVICGYLEQSIRIIFREYSIRGSNKYVARYADINLDRFQNPKMTKIIELTSFFNHEWAEEIRDTMSGKVESAVDGIVHTRHQIAHGVDTGITAGNLIRYFESVNTLIDYLWEKLV